MIIHCEVAVCAPSQQVQRFVRAVVGVGRDVVREAYFLVVVRTNQRDRFHLAKTNVKMYRSSFEFHTPNRYVMIRDCQEELLITLKGLIRKIVEPSHSAIPKVPNIERIYLMKPSQVSLSSIGASKAELKKLSNECLKTIELSSLKKVPSDIWTLKNLSILKLTDCKLKRVPRELHQLHRSLSCLILSRNEIDELPMWFCKRMINLKTLDLSWNKLRGLPFEIILLKCCKSFNFSNNSIFSLPNIFSMKILSTTIYDKIDLSHNNLHFIHANETTTTMASSLHSELDFSHNKFSHDFDLTQRLDRMITENDLNDSLFTRALEKVIADQRLFPKMFSDTVTPKPVYQAMQQFIFMCNRCRTLRIRLGHYVINTVERFPLQNYSGRLTHDFTGKLQILYLYCTLCKGVMDR